jgi:predicted NAD/FAD-binding protein
MKIAIIGTGISGLGTAYLLNNTHDITVYEKNKYVGGHSRTITIDRHTDPIAVDTGFIVFNNWNYPNLLGLFNELKVPFVNSDMSFGVSIHKNWLEYSSNDLFAPRNIFKPSYLGMLLEIVKFNKKAESFINEDCSITLGQCLDKLALGPWFRDYYLLAMGAAIWSSPAESILDFPAQTFIRFFKNHGLLNINNRPQWYTVTGGSKEYVARLTATFSDKIKCDKGVVSVARKGTKWVVTDIDDGVEEFDQVVFACHADEAIAMLENPSQDVRDVIGAFTYQQNKVIVHGDETFMPRNKKTWASWIYLSDQKNGADNCISLSYWMNNLQPLNTDKTILVTLNPGRRPKEHLIYDEHTFSHPVFDVPAIKAQLKIDDIQGKDGLWFCGAYQRYGFHEDGLLSAVNVATKMGIKIPWQ